MSSPDPYDYLGPNAMPSQQPVAQAHMFQFREHPRDESIELPKTFENGARVKGRMDNYWRNRIVRDFKPTVDLDKKAELELRKQKIHHKPRQAFNRVQISELLNNSC